MKGRSETTVVRLVKEVVEEALKIRPKHHTTASWLSYLITLGLEKLKEKKSDVVV